MVSGFVTSPWDHERIFSGLAKLMRIESKSAIKLARSYGLLRYKVVSSLPGFRRGRAYVPIGSERRRLRPNYSDTAATYQRMHNQVRLEYSVRCFFRLRLLPLHQLDVEAERL